MRAVAVLKDRCAPLASDKATALGKCMLARRCAPLLPEMGTNVAIPTPSSSSSAAAVAVANQGRAFVGDARVVQINPGRCGHFRGNRSARQSHCVNCATCAHSLLKPMSTPADVDEMGDESSSSLIPLNWILNAIIRIICTHPFARSLSLSLSRGHI